MIQKKWILHKNDTKSSILHVNNTKWRTIKIQTNILLTILCKNIEKNEQIV